VIRLLLLDLGETLVHAGAPLPHVPEALTAIAQLRTADGESLVSCLLSDFPLAEPPDDDRAVARRFDEYLGLLEGFGLRSFFEPVDQRVTLSTHAGVFKPDPRLFDLAIERSGLGASREQSLFVSEHRPHVDAARDLGLDGLVFAQDPSQTADFHDWSHAPAILHHRIAPDEMAGLAPSLSIWLEASEGLEVTALQPAAREADGPSSVRGSGRSWVPLEGGDLGELEGAMVPVPVSLAIDLDEHGGVAKVEHGHPDAEAVAEATRFAKSLLERGEIALEGDSRASCPWEVRADARGRRRLQRRHYRAS
jgi:FMN phosphatase YigB (HAD superfamily)